MLGLEGEEKKAKQVSSLAGLYAVDWKPLDLAESGPKGRGRDTRTIFEVGGEKRFGVDGGEPIPFGRDEKPAKIAAKIAACTMP